MSRIENVIRDVEAGVSPDYDNLATLLALDIARADEVFADEMIELMQQQSTRYDRLKSIKIGPHGITEAEFFRPAPETEVSIDG